MSMNYFSSAMIALVAIIWLVALAWAVLNYVLRSLSIYTVAKRRGSPNAGIAWVPVIWVWTLGGICDQYDGTRGIQRKWRVTLLILTVIGYAAVFIGYILMIAQLAKLAISQQNYVYGYRYDYEYAVPAEFVGALAGGTVLMILGAIAASAAAVCQWICQFKFFESCRPKDALKFTLLSILVPFARPICLMCCRNYDLGMPQQPQQPYYPTYPQQPQQYYAPQQMPQQPQEYYAPQQPSNNDPTPPPYNPYQ